MPGPVHGDEQAKYDQLVSYIDIDVIECLLTGGRRSSAKGTGAAGIGGAGAGGSNTGGGAG
jgi:hypothetical protein